jgi:hypothetical protein
LSATCTARTRLAGAARERGGPLLENVRIAGARETGATANARVTLPDGDSGDLERLIVGCLTDRRSGAGGESYLRPYFVQDTVAAARSQDYTDAELRCFERKLEAFTDEEIAEHVSCDKAEPPPSTRRMAEALACSATSWPR